MIEDLLITIILNTPEPILFIVVFAGVSFALFVPLYDDIRMREGKQKYPYCSFILVSLLILFAILIKQ